MNRLLLSVFVIALLLPTYSQAAILYLDPEKMDVGKGDTFILKVRVDNEGECINALEADITYPPGSLRAVDFSRGSSILSLWISDPHIDTEKGTVTFAGGIPGGYCGRIPGDPVVSNVVGSIVFTVLNESQDARIHIAPTSRVFLNDGLGTESKLTTVDASINAGPVPTLPSNAWLDEVGADTVSPDAFELIVQSSRDVFNGRYYIIFTTLDKQSGIDHYDIFERGAWKRIESPYVLRDQAIRAPIQVRAVDKAGNEQLGNFNPSLVPARESSPYEFAFIFSIIVLLVLAGIMHIYRRWSQPLPQSKSSS